MSDANRQNVYLFDHSESVLAFHNLRTATNSAAYLLGSIPPNARILDIGCGPGSITIDLARLFPGSHIIGIDSGAEVIEKAQSTAAERGLTNISFEVGNAHHLDFPDDSFDVVHGHQILQHIADPPLALREWRRVVKRGGVVACREADAGSAAIYPEVEGIEHFRQIYAKAARSRGGEPDGGRHLVAWAREAGFERSSITASASVWCFSSPEERVYWSDTFIGRLFNSSLRENAIAGWHASAQDLDRLVQGWREWAADEDAWWSLTHGEIVCRV